MPDSTWVCLPEQAFLNVGTIEDAIAKGKKLLEAAKG